MHAFTIKVRTSTAAFSYAAVAGSSSDAWFDASAAQGDTPCSITVMPASSVK